ncbi:MAG: chromate transporter [Clostridiales bacterium]|nr:chromate transporter [Clostridiales bacterium]
MIYFILFIEFFKIGLFSIGGGLATLPFLYDLINKYGWITSEELVDMLAISESTPGPIGINTATFVGYKTVGPLGGLIATLGIVTPAIIVMTIIAHYFMKFNEEPLVRAGFNGIRPAVVGLIAAAGYEVFKISLLNIPAYVSSNNLLELFSLKALGLFVIMLFGILKFKKHPILYIVLAGLIGIIFKY